MEINTVINMLLNGEAVEIPANGGKYAEIKKVVNGQGLILNWKHERWSPTVSISLQTI